MTQINFQLSEPGSTQQRDPVMSEYLRSYELPLPPQIRYGFTRLDSPQKSDRVNLFGQAWLPEGARGLVVLVHGYSEHSANYAQLIQALVRAKFAVAALDLRGHGLSEGPRGHAGSPETYAEDVEAFVSHVFPSLTPNKPLFLWAHSLGGMIGLQILLRNKLPVTLSGAVFTSPLLGFPELFGTQKFLANFASIVAKFFSTLPIQHGIASTILSHDEEYLARRIEDPLINAVSTPGWFVAIRAAMKELHARSKEFQHLAPTNLLLAGDEKVTNLNEARKFAFHAYGTMKHKVIEFPGYYHELEKEPGVRDRIISETIGWFQNHLKP